MSCAAEGWPLPPISPPPRRIKDHDLYFQAERAWQELGRPASQREHWSAGDGHLCLFDPQDGTLVELTSDDDADSATVRWVFVDPTGSTAPSQGSGEFEQAVQACGAYASGGSPTPQQPLTAERFFALADSALELGLRLELIDGRVVAMAGASPNHEAIVISTGMALKPGQPRGLRNPSVVVEVLSPSTGHKDTGEKVQTYLSIDSLELYIIVHSDRRLVEVWRPGATAPQPWNEGEIPLGLHGRTVALDDIYDQVEL